MLVVVVNAHVKSEFIESFKTASLDNAQNSIQEPGVIRFDVYQQNDDLTRFTLLEIYRTENDPLIHRQTAHYARWRDTVESMMAEPRTRTENHLVFPTTLD